MPRRATALVLALSGAGCLSTPPRGEPDAGPSCAQGFEGAKSNTRLSTGTNRLILVEGQPMGTYTSPIVDAGEAHTWSLSWTTVTPSLKALPDNGGADTGYLDGVDMTGNVLLYHLDEPVGTTVVSDSSPSGLTSSCSPSFCPVMGASALFGKGATTGTDQRLTRSTDQALEQPLISVEAWARKDGPHGGGGGTAGAIVTRGFNGGGEPFSSYSLEQVETDAVESPSSLRFYLGNATSGVTAFTTNAAPNGAYFHTVGTFDGSTIRIYLDGTQGGEAPMAVPIEFAAQSTHDLTIGTYGMVSQDFNGTIDEVAIYDHPLTAAEVRSRWLRGALRVHIQARSCDDPACDGEDFVGPDATAGTFFSESCNPSLGPPRDVATRDIDCDGDGLEDDGMNDEALPARRYAQFRIFLETADPNETPAVVDAQLCADP